MPDLNIEYHQWCASNETWRRSMFGSNGDIHTVKYGRLNFPGNYEYGYICTCKAFQYGKGKECKHIKEAKKHHCMWNHEAIMGSSKKIPLNLKCPQCGEDLLVIAIGV